MLCTILVMFLPFMRYMRQEGYCEFPPGDRHIGDGTNDT